MTLAEEYPSLPQRHVVDSAQHKGACGKLGKGGARWL